MFGLNSAHRLAISGIGRRFGRELVVLGSIGSCFKFEGSGTAIPRHQVQ